MTKLPRGAGEQREGIDGKVVSYRERLVSPLIWWLFTIALAGALGIAYGHFLGATIGWITTAISEAVLGGILWFRAAPIVRIDDQVFRAGPARLPLRFVGEIQVLTEAATRSLRGPTTDPDAYLCLRLAVARRAVAVVVADPQDPHPYWLVTSRHPERLAAALTQARDVHATM